MGEAIEINELNYYSTAIHIYSWYLRVGILVIKVLLVSECLLLSHRLF